MKALMAAIDAARPAPERRSPEESDDRPGPRNHHRRLFALSLALVVIGAALAGWLALRPPDLAGQWRLADDSVWMVQQSGRNLDIEEIHYQSREVWRRGKAQLTGNELRVEMHYVFEPTVHLHGSLQVGADGRSIVGALTQSPGQGRIAFSMRR